MEVMKGWQIPAFGNWENCDEIPISHYLDSVSQAGTRFFGEEDLFKVPVAMPVNYDYPYGGHYRRKVRQGNGVGAEKRQMKQGRGLDATAGTPRRRKTPIAVDEDLYKIPPELLYQKPKSVSSLSLSYVHAHKLLCSKFSMAGTTYQTSP